MRRLLLPLAFLVACSSDPVPPVDDVPRGDAFGRLPDGDSDAPTDMGVPDLGFDAGPRDAESRDAAAAFDAFIGTEPVSLPDVQLPDVPADIQRDMGIADRARSDAGSEDAAAACVYAGPEETAAACADDIDNDCNGFADCRDFSCSRNNPAVTFCSAADAGPSADRPICDSGGAREDTVAACTDGIDNDCDGFVDCADFFCPSSACPRDAGRDVPRDTGPVDGGPVVYDLEAARTALDVRVAFTELGYTGGRTICDAPTAPTCLARAGDVSFFFDGCFGGNPLTGRIMIGTGARTAALDFNGQYLPTLRITSGTVRSGRQSFHVQFAGPVVGARSGAEGIPGRTVDPALGDIWILGCPSD